MTPSIYLYGSELSKLKAEPYETVILHKVIMSQDLLGRLVRNDGMQDITRMNKVVAAIKFNRNLLTELGYDSPTITQKLKDLNGCN